MNIYVDDVAVAKLEAKLTTTIAELKQTIDNFLRQQNITKYTIELRFNDGVMLNPIVFETNTYDLVNFQQHANQIDGAYIIVRTSKTLPPAKLEIQVPQEKQVYRYYIPYNDQGSYNLRDRYGRVFNLINRFAHQAYLDNNPNENALVEGYNRNLKFIDDKYLHGIRKWAAILSTRDGPYNILLYNDVNIAKRDFITTKYNLIVSTVFNWMRMMEYETQEDHEEVHKLIELWEHNKNPYVPTSKIITKYVVELISSGDLSLENMINYANTNGFLVIFPDTDYQITINFIDIKFL